MVARLICELKTVSKLKIFPEFKLGLLAIKDGAGSTVAFKTTISLIAEDIVLVRQTFASRAIQLHYHGLHY